MLIIGGICCKYHFRRKRACRVKHVFVATKHVFCRDKSMLASRNVLSHQPYFLSRQIYACRDKRCALSRQTRVLSRQKLYLRQLPPVTGAWAASYDDALGPVVEVVYVSLQGLNEVYLRS